jgi:hypothetical protein
MATASRFCVFLDQEHHEKGDDGRAGIDHSLPGIGVVEQGPQTPHATITAAVSPMVRGLPHCLEVHCAAREKKSGG